MLHDCESLLLVVLVLVVVEVFQRTSGNVLPVAVLALLCH